MFGLYRRRCGSRRISKALRYHGIKIDRFKVRRLILLTIKNEQGGTTLPVQLIYYTQNKTICYIISCFVCAKLADY